LTGFRGLIPNMIGTIRKVILLALGSFPK